MAALPSTYSTRIIYELLTDFFEPVEFALANYSVVLISGWIFE